jgi:hypothetical protein
MEHYELKLMDDLEKWKRKITKGPGYVDRLTKKWQDKLNGYIPEKVHSAITATIKQMFRLVIFGSAFTTRKPRREGNLELRDAVVDEKINFYKKTASLEGGITGAGGILMGLADFPLLLGIKIKLLHEVAAEYGFNVDDYKERLYILLIFQLAFCSQQTRKDVFLKMMNWETTAAQLPNDLNEFDWRTFQQEYRDYIDLAKMAQLIPIIGAPVGAVVNYGLIRKLGTTAKHAYHMRILQNQHGLKP